MNRLSKIKNPDRYAAETAKNRWNNIGKPLRSLGLLEEYIIKIAGITGSADIDLQKRLAVVFCSDNGVVCEKIAQSDSVVTSIVANAIAEGTSSINRMAKTFHADVLPVDIGIDREIHNKKILNKKIAFGTENITKGPAMTRENAEKAISVGMDIVMESAKKGYKILVTGEMGIGNTTTSSAIAAVYLNASAEEVTGRGAGIDNLGLARKINAVKEAVKINSPDKDDPLDVLSKLGGYDIAGMTGLFLGGAVYGIPVVIDGFISAAAALTAVKINPLAKEYMLCSHVSKETAAKKILDLIGLKPLITAELALGEGTGGILLLPLLDGALSVYNSAHSFGDLKMERYVEY